MDYKVQHTERLNAPLCSFARQPACLRRRPPGGLMADDVRHSALGRVRGDQLVGIDINIDGTRCHRVIYVLEQARFIVSCEGRNLPILITS